MQVVDKPKKVVRVRIDAIEDGKNIPGGEAIHLTETSINEVYLLVVKALGVQDQILKGVKRNLEANFLAGVEVGVRCHEHGMNLQAALEFGKTSSEKLPTITGDEAGNPSDYLRNPYAVPPSEILKKAGGK